MSKHTFDILFLIARPAAGKSEIIDYLQRMDEAARGERLHLGQIHVIDDFPMLWAWFEEDAILEGMGKPRLHTKEDGSFRFPYLWHLLIERLALEYEKLLRDRPSYHDTHTVLVEFARGQEHGGFREAFSHFPPEMLRRGAILYIDVSWEESLRKNRQRYNPERPDSILEHALPDDRLRKLYREMDWESFSGDHPEFISIQGVPVPYAVFENEDDITTDRGPALGERLEETLGRLWEICGRRGEGVG